MARGPFPDCEAGHLAANVCPALVTLPAASQQHA